MVTGRDAWLVVGVVLLAFVIVQTMIVLTLGFKMMMGNKATLPSPEVLLLLNAALLGVVLLCPVLLIGKERRWSWREAFRWRSVHLVTIILTAFGTLALGVAASQIVLWLAQWADTGLQRSKLEQLLSLSARSSFPGLVLLAVMFPALPEELVFRGVVQQGFEQRYRPAVAIALASLCFVLLHLDPLQIIGILPIALFWGWVTFRAQSVIPSLIAHALQNGVTVIAIIVSKPEWQEGLVSPLQAMPPEPKAFIGGLLVWIAIVFALAITLPKTKRGEIGGERRANFHQTGTSFRSDGGASAGPDERS